MNNEVYIITDGCLWEQNKKNSTYYPHAIEVVTIETGQVRYIKSGSKITFVEGEITENRSQETYNKTSSQVSGDNEAKLHARKSKGKGGKRLPPTSKAKGV